MMKQKIYIILAFVVLFAPIIAFAAAPGSGLGTITDSSTAGEYNASSYTATGISTKITGVVDWFSWGIALVAVVMGLYSGFLFITARGEPAQLKTARATLLWAVIGIAVAVLAFSIIAITKSILTLT
ncbi:MAG: hypothetical protein NUV61_02530 [Candidatus Azambacteria bacterium]|nr:hypothetical protein [Candidatus Azambacteria bacterium]